MSQNTEKYFMEFNGKVKLEKSGNLQKEYIITKKP